MNSYVVDNQVLLSLAEVASRLSLSKRTIEREIARGRFPKPIKIGRRTLVRVTDLNAFVGGTSGPSESSSFDALDAIDRVFTPKGGMKNA